MKTWKNVKMEATGVKYVERCQVQKMTVGI